MGYQLCHRGRVQAISSFLCFKIAKRNFQKFKHHNLFVTKYKLQTVPLIFFSKSVLRSGCFDFFINLRVQFKILNNESQKGKKYFKIF